MEFTAHLTFLCLFERCFSASVDSDIRLSPLEVSSKAGNLTSFLGKETKTFNLGFTKDPNIENKVFVDNFVSLPAELKVIILGYLSPKELLEFIQIEEFKEYRDLATAAFGIAYKSHSIGYRLIKKDDIVVENGDISISNLTTFTTFLKLFNKHVKSLKVDNSAFRDDELQTVLDAVDEHCANTLTKLEIRQMFGNELAQIKEMTFPNVEEFFIFSNYFRNQSLDLEDAFPNVRRLTVTNTRFTDRNWIDKSFSNLNALHVDLNRDFKETEVVKLLEKNPGITTLGLVCTNFVA